MYSHHDAFIRILLGQSLTTPSGMDLTGNTFWEFTDQINIGRLRRIVEYDKKAHYADVKLARTSSLPLPPPISYPNIL